MSPTLAQLIQKCAATEAGGASPHDALLASAGMQVGEIEALRDQNGRCAEKLSRAQEHAAQLQRALDHAQGIIARHDKVLDDLRREVRKAAETNKGSRDSISALKVRIGELQMKVSNSRGSPQDYLTTDGLDEAAVMALKALSDGLRHEKHRCHGSWRRRLFSWRYEAAMSRQDAPDPCLRDLARPSHMASARRSLSLLRSPPLQ